MRYMPTLTGIAGRTCVLYLHQKANKHKLDAPEIKSALSEPLNTKYPPPPVVVLVLAM